LYGYLLVACRMWERVALVIAAFLLIAPELISSLIGIALLLGIAAKQKFLDRPAPAAASKPAAK
jgi:UPF0716 family protein affecting phage T7 exclusion